MKRLVYIIMIVVLTLSICGCSKSNADTKSISTPASKEESLQNNSVKSKEGLTTITLGKTIQIEGSGAEARGNVVSITEAGDYSISGSLENGQVVINADKAVFNIELAGASITNKTGPAIYVQDAKTTNIILKDETVNTLTDGAEYSDKEQKAALFSADTLVIKGNGQLTVNGNYKHAIASDDEMTIENGNIMVQNAVTDGLHANDGIIIENGTLLINASSDAIESEQFITINGGSIEISAYDDAIHAETVLTINGGNINALKCYEGLEGKETIVINGGEINLKCDDDSVNAGIDLTINDGYLYADCNGDGLDSNGSMTINGGTITVFSGNNANGPIDVGDRGSSFIINGGTVLATGGNMGISVSESSKQYSMWINSQTAANTLISVKENGGKDLISFAPVKSSSLIFFSSDSLKANGIYEIYTGGSHSGALKNGIYSSGSHVEGTLLGTVTMTAKSASYGQSRGGMGGWNDKGPGEGQRRPMN